MAQKESKHVAIERSTYKNIITATVFTDTVDLWWEDAPEFAKISVS